MNFVGGHRVQGNGVMMGEENSFGNGAGLLGDVGRFGRRDVLCGANDRRGNDGCQTWQRLPNLCCYSSLQLNRGDAVHILENTPRMKSHLPGHLACFQKRKKKLKRYED